MEAMLADNAPYVFAMLGTTLGAVTFLHARIREQIARRKFYEAATTKVMSALKAADRVLSNKDTPPAVRRHLLVLLEMLATPEVGRDFTKWFLMKKTRRDAPAQIDDDQRLSTLVDRLHVEQPALAADVHEALMGIILALPVIHASKVKVFEVAGEGAIHPESVFDRAANFARVNINGRHSPKVAHC